MQQEQMPPGPMELMVRGGEQKEDTHQIITQISGNVNRAKGSEAETCGRGRGGGWLLGFSEGQGGPSRAEIRSTSRRQQGKRRGEAGPAGDCCVEKGLPMRALRSGWDCNPGGGSLTSCANMISPSYFQP